MENEVVTNETKLEEVVTEELKKDETVSVEETPAQSDEAVAETEDATAAETTGEAAEEVEEEVAEEVKEVETKAETLEPEPGFELMVEKGLPTMGIGMFSIFVVIGVVIGCVSLLSKIKCDGNFSRGLSALFGKK